MTLSRRSFLTGLAAAGAIACGAATDPGPGADPTLAGDPPDRSGTADGPDASSPAPPESSGPGGSSSTTGRTEAGAAAFVTHGSDQQDAIALTFHTNGDLGLAQQILDVCDDHEAVFTSFIVGNWLDANPTWAKKLLDHGHELANHTYTHPEFTSLSSAAMVDEITRCRDAIRRLTGDGGRYFRPSGTDDGTSTPSGQILQAAATAGYDTVLGWTNEPFDYQDPGARAVQTRVLEQAAKGGIVSLHFGHPGTIAALPAILDGLQAKNLEPVTVSTLLG